MKFINQHFMNKIAKNVAGVVGMGISTIAAGRYGQGHHSIGTFGAGIPERFKEHQVGIDQNAEQEKASMRK